MTRETKVGLVIGLGVILLVGIIVSEYFVREDVTTGQPNGQGLADFNNNSNQSARHTPGNDGGVLPAYREPVGTASAVEPLEGPGPAAAAQQPEPRPGRRSGPAIGANIAIEQPGIGQRGGQETETPPAQPGNPIHAAIGGGPGEHLAQPAPDRPTGDPIFRDPPDRLAEGEVPEYDLTQPPPQPIGDGRPRPTAVEHTVAEGETLTQIARLHYDGDGNMWRSIRDANRERVGPEGQVRAGTVLTIPKRGGGSADGRGAAEQAEVAQTLADNERVVAQRGRLVTVAEGDTLSGLASEHLGSAGKWQLLLDANTDVLTDPDQLRPGMRLRVPAAAETQVAEQANEALRGEGETTGRAAEPTPTTPEPPVGRTYTVQSGDSLYRIAEKTMGGGGQYLRLYEANKDKLSSPDAIREGMVLVIPAAPND